VYPTEKEIMPILVRVALGVKYLHDNHVCHGVLQPRNILVGEARESDSGRSGGVTVRFTDYGVGHVCGDDVAE
jgi:serine/threonine protein kinase